MTEPMILRVRVAAPVRDVHRALTDPARLKVWLAEHAEVELPHRYEFWGRHTPEGDVPHQRLLHADDRGLRFAWVLDGVETTTEISLAAEDDATTVITLSQSHFDVQEALSGTTVRGVLQTYWCLSLANLVDHLEGRPLTPKADFTSPHFREEFVIDAPAQAVYASLTDSEQASAWFGYPIGIEPHEGGRFAMGGLENNPEPAKIFDVRPGVGMSIDWGPGGVTTWELAESAGKTRLTFISSGFDEQRPPYAGWLGWLSGLAELRRYHELPNWRPIYLPDEAPANS